MDTGLSLCLIFKQQEGEKKIQFALPKIDKFTIGRYGDIVPEVGGAAISRIHATVTKFSDHWLVDDGDGESLRPSSNGIFNSSGDRASQVVLRTTTDWVDLLPPQEGLLARIICEAECDRSQLYARETGGFDDYWMQHLMQEVAAIKAQQEKQAALFDEFVRLADKENRRQNAFIKGLLVASAIMAAGLVVDPSKRDGYIDSAIKILGAAAAGTATIAISQKQSKVDVD